MLVMVVSVSRDQFVLRTGRRGSRSGEREREERRSVLAGVEVGFSAVLTCYRRNRSA